MTRRFRELSWRAQVATVVATSSLIGAVAWRASVWPLRAENETIRIRLADDDQNRHRRTAVAKALPLLQQEVRRLDVVVAQLQTHVGDEVRSRDILAAFSDLARIEGVEIAGFKPRDAVDRAGYRERPVELVINGNFHDVMRFFDGVVAMPVLVSLSDLHVRTGGGGGGRGTVTLAVVASTHVFPSTESEVPAESESDPAFESRTLAYDDEGRRDPFRSLVASGAPTPRLAAQPRREGLAGVLLADVIVRGVLRHGDHMLAILETPARQAFVARPNDRLADSSVFLIDRSGVVFMQNGGEGTMSRIRKPLLSNAQEGR